MYTVAAMLYPDALATSVTLPMEILHAASQMASVRKKGQQQVRFLLASTDRKAVQLATGIVLKPDVTIGQLATVDLLILPAIWRNPASTIQYSRPWLELLNTTAASGSLICSVGTASALLAEAGLLAGRPATTHWNYFERFAKRYPTVDLKTRHLITQSDNIYCVGSVNSIADPMVHIVEGWFGSKISRAVESQFSPEIRQSFWSASYQDLPDSSHHDELILEAQQWLQEQMGSSIRMQMLADALQVSLRSLNRRFKQATGFTPNDYLQSLRVNMAKDLLRHSNLCLLYTSDAADD